MFEQLQLQLEDMKASKKRWTFTLESGRGETYANSRPTLYGHSTYERGSVLEGRDQRVFVYQWNDWSSAREELASLQKRLKWFRYEDSGSTHVPVDQIVNHLPDDTDY